MSSHSDLKSALAKTNSLKLSVINVIMELRAAADAASARGDLDRSAELDREAALLARESVEIRLVEDRLRARQGLSEAIQNLNTISGDARGTLAAIRLGGDLLEHAATLLRILGHVAKIVP